MNKWIHFFPPKVDAAKSYNAPGIHIDRNFNPFKDQIPSKINDTAMVNLTEMYQQESSALPSKINLLMMKKMRI